MPTYSISAPDGNTYKIEGPAGASQEQVQAEVLKQNPNAGRPPEKGNMYTQGAEDIQYSPEGIPLNTSSYGSAPTGITKDVQQALTSTTALPLNIATGVAKAPAGLAQLVGKYFGSNAGDIPVNAINQIEKGTQAQMGDVGSAASQVGSAVGQVAPMMGIGTIGMIPSLAQKVAQGTGMGLLSGALTPEKTGLTPQQFADEKARNMALQAGIGATIPMAGQVLKTGYNAAKSLVEPLYTGGREKIIGRALRQFAGNDAEQAIANMKNAQPLVHGSQPTVAEVAGVPSLAAAQRAAMGVSPEATNALTNRQAAQNMARIQAIEDIKPPKEAIMDLREKATEDLYKRANAEKVIATPDIKKLLARPSMEKALARAKNLAKEKGEDLEFTKEIPAMASSILDANGKPLGNIPAQEGSLLGKAAHYIKRGLDDLTNYPQEHGVSGSELNAIRDTKKLFLNAIETQLPTYKAARETFAALSKPISQADIIEEIGKSANFRGNLTPASLAKALSDKTAQKVTGQKNATLEQALEPKQMAVLQNIKQDLLNSDFAQTAGKPVGSNTIQNLAYGNMLNQVNLPNLLRRHGLSETLSNLGARAGDIVYGKANKELANQFAETLLDPKQAAAYMEIVKSMPKGTKMTPEAAKQIERANLAKLLLMQSTAKAAQ